MSYHKKKFYFEKSQRAYIFHIGTYYYELHTTEIHITRSRIIYDLYIILKLINFIMKLF